MKEVDFIDTNILVYGYDRHDLKKQQKAQQIILDGVRKESLALSPQVLGEFYTVVTRKIDQPLSLNDAEEIILYLGRLPVQEIDFIMVARALDTCGQYHLSYWDSLIIAAAERAGCRRILTEDLNTGQMYHGIEAVNPFA